MEINVDIDEYTFALIKSSGRKDVSTIVNDALMKWVHANILKCPLDGNFCTSKESCNCCIKLTNSEKGKPRSKN